jgi:putative ABC transport system permease protein
MIIKNQKSFINHLLNNKLYTIVTVLGFTISLTFVILLSIYVKNELSVNKSQEKKDRIFRLINEVHSTYAPPIGQWLQDEIPEIESFTRISNQSGVLSISDNVKVKTEYLLADSTFFNIFSFNLIEGNKVTALKTRNSVVLSEEFAHKIFGSESPLNKQVILSGITCEVTGVYEDISSTSNFNNYDMIVNFRCLADIWNYPGLLTSYGNCSFAYYFLAKPNTNLPDKAEKVLELFKKDFWMYKDDRVKSVTFEPLIDNYFSTIYGRGITHNSSTLVTVLSAIVVLILLLAIINYMNLTIAQAGMRAKEIAIKKLVGSSRKQLVMQHIAESVSLCVLSFILAIFFSFFAEPVFNDLLQTKLNLNEEIYKGILLYSILIVVGVGFVSGIIPALILTRFDAVEVIKGGYRRKSKRLYSRLLIGFQYTVVIILLISTISITKQTNYLINRELGFNTVNTIWLDNAIKNTQKDALRDKFLSIPGVKRVSYVAGSPIDGGNNQSFNYDGKPVSFQELVVDSSFFDIMDMKIIPTGAAYSKSGIMLNRMSVTQLGLDSLPQVLKYNDKEIPVLGIINDFHIKSLHHKIGLVMVSQMHPDGYPWNIIVQVEGADPVGTLEKVKLAYGEFTGGTPFDYGFFDDTIEEWYTKEKRTLQVVTWFAVLAIIISVMGIFAMSIFYNQQRKKEIGIRKVNGASVSEIMLMLNKDFVKWVLVAFVVACPVAYYAMNSWLQNFAYKTTLSWWIFAMAGIVALAIALITVSWQTFVAARRNPVTSLRYE